MAVVKRLTTRHTHTHSLTERLRLRLRVVSLLNRSCFHCYLTTRPICQKVTIKRLTAPRKLLDLCRHELYYYCGRPPATPVSRSRSIPVLWEPTTRTKADFDLMRRITVSVKVRVSRVRVSR